jgi:protein arginine kinase
MLTVENMIQHPAAWLTYSDKGGIVMSSRVRLARNLQHHHFPDWAPAKERWALCEQLCQAFGRTRSLKDGAFMAIKSLPEIDRDVLLERHLISHDLAGHEEGGGVLITADERVSAMVNEEDHLRLQVMLPGLDLDAAWQQADAIDSDLEQHTEYAFSERLGYLTACPTNLGTGMRAGVLMHLSALKLTESLDAVVNGLERLGLTVRGFSGEGSEALGNMFQVSNQVTLGESETATITHLKRLIDELIRHEQNARDRLLEERRSYLFDQMGRALGMLLYARMLSCKETIDLMAGIRLGVEMGLIHGLTMKTVDEIMILTRPGHLRKLMESETATESERDEARARFVRERLRSASLGE